MKFLITGGCGFIGREFIREVMTNPSNAVRVLDNETVCNRNDLATLGYEISTEPNNWVGDCKSIGFISGDIRDQEVVTTACLGADVVIHLAANTGVGPSVDNPRMDCEVNILGTLNVLEACKEHSVDRLVFASSGAPLGVQTPPLHEELAAHPASPYGASKLSGEGYCSAYYHSFGVESVVLRFGNVYGPGSGHKSSVVAKFIKKALAGESLEIYGTGDQTRDYIYIKDLINAIKLAATTTNDVAGEIFQIATNRETSVSEMTQILFDVLKNNGVVIPKITFSEMRTGDVMRNYSDTSKAKNILGWETETDLKSGLVETVTSFIAH